MSGRYYRRWRGSGSRDWRPWLNERFEFTHITAEGEPWAISDELDGLTLKQRRWQWVRRRLRLAVPPEQRRAIELYYLEGLTLRECAQVLEVHHVTVRRRIVRGLRMLRRQARAQVHLWPEARVR